MKKTIAITIFGLFLGFSMWAQKPVKYATLEVWEHGMAKKANYMVFVDENGEKEMTPLLFKGAIGTDKFVENVEANQETITKKLNEIGKKGYVLVGIMDPGDGSSRMIFKKEE